MTNMKNKKQKIIVIALPIITVGLFFVVKYNLGFFLSLLPKQCLIHALLGIQCPGCGNTRSIISLLNFDIISSLKYNIFPVFALIVCITAYTELLLKAFFKPKKLLPRNVYFWIGVSVCFVLYWILRNII